MYLKYPKLSIVATMWCTVGVGTTCDVRLLVVVSAQHVRTGNVKHSVHRHFKRSIFKSRRFNYNHFKRMKVTLHIALLNAAVVDGAYRK